MSTSAIPNGSHIAIDSAAFIYYLELHPRYRSVADELFRRIDSGRLSACASILILTELLVPCHRSGDVAGASRLSRAVRTMPNLALRSATEVTAERAALLRGRYGLRSPDALHLATCLEDGAAWFVTNDVKLKRVAAEGIRVWLFDENV